MLLSTLEQIAIVDSTNMKHNLVDTNKNNDMFKKTFELAYSPKINFGIKKFPAFDPISQPNATLQMAYDLLENDLAKRVTTGNLAIEKLANILANMKSDDVEVIRRIIQRDLEIGVGKTIANKVWKDLIPEQPKMLASSMSDKTLAKIVYPAYAQLKADGARCFAEIIGDTMADVRMISRNTNEYMYVDRIKQQLLDMTQEVRKLPEYANGVVIDGELVYTSINETSGVDSMFDDDINEVVVLRSESNGIANKSLKGTITQSEANRLVFQVWDIYPIDAYAGIKSKPYVKRFDELASIVNGYSNILLIENNVVNSLDDAKKVFKKYLDMGLEGIILKNLHGLWEDKRSANQVKFKEVVNVDMEIIDVYPHKKDPNKLGGITIASKCRKIVVNCGSGFTDTDKIKVKGNWIEIPLEERDELNRARLWAIKDTLIGKIVEVSCNSWVASKTKKDTLSLFLPIMEKFRIDKDEANTFEDAFGEECPL